MPIYATKPPTTGRHRDYHQRPRGPAQKRTVFASRSFPLQFVQHVDNNSDHHGQLTHERHACTRTPSLPTPSPASAGVPSVLTDRDGVEITKLPGEETARCGVVIMVPPCRDLTTLIVRIPGEELPVGTQTDDDVYPIRRKSKASNAKLQEGDEVLSVNGRSVRNVGRDVAMGYVDTAMDTLDIEVVRRSNGGQTIPINASSTQHVNGNTEIRRVPTYQVGPSAQLGTPHSKQTSTTTHVQTRTDGGGVIEETTTKTITERIGEEDGKTTTTRDIKKYAGPQEPLENTGLNRQGRGNSVTFTAPKINVPVNPAAVWTASDRSQPKKTQLAYSSSAPTQVSTTAHVQYSVGDDEQETTSQPKHYRKVVPFSSVQQPKPSSRKPFQEQSQQNAETVPKPVRWQPQIHHSITPRMEPDPSATTTWSGSVSGPRRTSIGKEVTITFAPQGLTSKRYSTDSGKPPPPVAPVEVPVCATTRVEIDKQIPRKEEPTVILRRAAPQENKDDILDETDDVHRRPYSYPGKHSEDDPEISTRMRMKACKTIADLLMFPSDKHAKGARMFAKRRKRSDRWSVEGMGQNPGKEEEEETEDEVKSKGVEITLVSSGRKPLPPGAVPIGMPLPPPPPPPPPPQEGGQPYIPPPPPPPPPGTKYRIKVEPTNFKVNLKSKEKCAHDIVSPEQMGRLVVDLKAASGRGANMFERRRQRSDQFVIDESTVKPPPVLKKPAKQKGVTTAKFTVKQDQKLFTPQKSPWEAAVESPVGNCDSAFHHLPQKRQSFTHVDSVESGPPPTKPKPPAAWMSTSKMLPETPSKALSKPPAIRPRFNANDASQPPVAAAPVYKPMFDAKRLPSEFGTGTSKSSSFNNKPRGWNSPHNSGENTPTSQTSMNSMDDALNVGSIFPTRTPKYSTSFNDFNRKPRGWGNKSESQEHAATNGRSASYHFGSTPAPFTARLNRETNDL